MEDDDHDFLNRTGIFRVLQTVLEDARSALEAVSVSGGGGGGSGCNSDQQRDKMSCSSPPSLSPSPSPSSQAPQSYSMQHTSLSRLSALALKVVHVLATQVASAPLDTPQSLRVAHASSIAPQLRHMPSGPDTFSRSLFDMLHIELFVGLRSIVQVDIGTTRQRRAGA